MNRIFWWMVDALCRALDGDEREVVRGDLAESGDGPGAALIDVLGLVIRRQAVLWKDWRPWLGLTAIVLPLGLLLGFHSVSLGRTYDLYLWILGNYGSIDPRLLRDAGLQVAPGVRMLVLHSVLVACWAWSAGFVLSALCRRVLRVNGALFCAVLIGGELVSAPRVHYYVAGAAFLRSLSMLTLPLLLLATLVVLPAIAGMWQGRRNPSLGLNASIPLAAAIAALTVMNPIALWWCNWPVLYILATSRGRSGSPTSSGLC
ncbi:MAG TPA: hypothetical protein VKU19_06720 [Bryobacteraceae bacterium]|nr:hypothetical protein [Bryobacteraceae bacterium]